MTISDSTAPVDLTEVVPSEGIEPTRALNIGFTDRLASLANYPGMLAEHLGIEPSKVLPYHSFQD